MYNTKKFIGNILGDKYSKNNSSIKSVKNLAIIVAQKYNLPMIHAKLYAEDLAWQNGVSNNGVFTDDEWAHILKIPKREVYSMLYHNNGLKQYQINTVRK